MTTAIDRAYKATRRRALTVCFILAILFGCYGLLSAQEARSESTSSGQVWGGIRADGSIAHQAHITSVTHSFAGAYEVTFDRRVDNCSLQATSRDEGGTFAFASYAIGPGSSTSQVIVAVRTEDATQVAEADFDIFGQCAPSTK